MIRQREHFPFTVFGFIWQHPQVAHDQIFPRVVGEACLFVWATRLSGFADAVESGEYRTIARVFVVYAAGVG